MNVQPIVVEVHPADLLEIEAQVSVISPDQVIFLEGLNAEAVEAANRSEAWAVTQEDIEVEPGLYSSFHHAVKSAASSVAANDSQTASAASESSSAASAEQSRISQESSTESAEDSAASAAEAKASENSARVSERAAEGYSETAQESMVEAANSEAAAHQSEQNSKASEQASAGSATEAAQSQEAAKQSEVASAQSSSASAESAAQSLESQNAAANSQSAAAESEQNSQASETAAAHSADSAAQSESASDQHRIAAATSAAESAESQAAAKDSETESASSQSASAESELSAASSASQALQSEQSAAVSESLARLWAQEEKDVPVEASEYSAYHWSKVAEQFAGTLTNGMYFAGSWDLIDGLPPEPETGAVPWYRIVSTEVSQDTMYSLDLETIASEATPGDQIFWDPESSEWVLIDSTDKVWSVNGKIGDVDLDAEDVGADTSAEVDAKIHALDTGVTSVNGESGEVVLEAGDVGADTSSEVDAKIAAIPEAPVASVNSKTGAVVLDAEDVGAATPESVDAAVEPLEKSTTVDEKIHQSLIDSALPDPDFHMPLIADTNIYQGFGFSEFTRDSIATYTNKSGVLTRAEKNEPRFEHEGILIEGGSTNLVPYSYENFRTPLDVIFVGESTKTLLEETAKIYELPSDLLVPFTGSNGRQAIEPSTRYSGTIFIDLDEVEIGSGTLRFQFAFATNWSNQYVLYELSTGEIRYTCEAASAKILPNNILRLTITTTSNPVTDPDGGSLDIYAGERFEDFPGSQVLTEGDRVGLFSWQLEQLPFASSYIPTGGEPVTRAAEVLSLSVNPLGFTEYTLAAKFTTKGIQSENVRFFDFRGTASNFHWLLWDGETASHRYGGSSDASSFEETDLSEMSLIISGTSVYIDGMLRVEGDSFTPMSGFLSANIGGDTVTGNRPLNGHVRDFKIWHQALTDTQIAAIG